MLPVVGKVNVYVRVESSLILLQVLASFTLLPLSSGLCVMPPAEGILLSLGDDARLISAYSEGYLWTGLGKERSTVTKRLRFGMGPLIPAVRSGLSKRVSPHRRKF